MGQKMKLFYSLTVKGCVFVMLYAGLKRGKAHYNIINDNGVEIASCVPKNEVLKRCKSNIQLKQLQNKRIRADNGHLDDFLEFTAGKEELYV